MQSYTPWSIVCLFLPLKRWRSSIIWSVLYRFHSLYHYCHSLSLMPFVVKCCNSLYHLLSLFVTRCTILCNSLSLVVIRCNSPSFVVTRCHSLSLVLPLAVIRCHSMYHLSVFFINDLYNPLSLWTVLKYRNLGEVR